MRDQMKRAMAAGDPSEIGARLRWMRTEGWYKVPRGTRAPTQDEVAAAAGLTQSSYGKHERGENEPTASQVIAYGLALQADPGWLLVGQATTRAAWPVGWEPPGGRNTLDRELNSGPPVRATPPTVPAIRRRGNG